MRPRDRVIEDIGQNSFSVLDQACTLSEVRKNDRRVDDETERQLKIRKLVGVRVQI